jgi:hypothetical protein
MGKQYLNGVLYGTGEIIKFSPEIYSEEEREVGVFTDGRPLYKKTFECTFDSAVSGSSQGEYVDLIYLPDVNVKKVEAYELNGSTLYPFTGYSLTRGIQLVNFRYIGDYVKLYTVSTPYSVGEKIIVTVYYTKTTDTPGSGHYTTTGGEAVHYSQTEQIIGTWFDEPLYEKTFDLGTNGLSIPSAFASQWSSPQNLGLDAGGKIVGECKGVTLDGLYSTTLNVFKNSSTGYVMFQNLTVAQLTYRYITLQYTKTTV